MAESIIERIYADLLSVSVTTGGGYNYTLVIEREARGGVGNRSRDGLVVISQSSSTTLESSSQFKGIMAIFDCTIFSHQSDTDSTDWITKANRMAGDLSKALLVDPTRNGLANDTIIDQHMIESDDETAMTIARLQIQINFDHLWNNPFSGRA